MDMPVHKRRCEVFPVGVEYLRVFSDAMLAIANHGNSAFDDSDVGIFEDFTSTHVDELCVYNDEVGFLNARSDVYKVFANIPFGNVPKTL